MGSGVRWKERRPRPQVERLLVLTAAQCGDGGPRDPPSVGVPLPPLQRSVPFTPGLGAATVTFPSAFWPSFKSLGRERGRMIASLPTGSIPAGLPPQPPGDNAGSPPPPYLRCSFAVPAPMSALGRCCPRGPAVPQPRLRIPGAAARRGPRAALTPPRDGCGAVPALHRPRSPGGVPPRSAAHCAGGTPRFPAPCCASGGYHCPRECPSAVTLLIGLPVRPPPNYPCHRRAVCAPLGCRHPESPLTLFPPLPPPPAVCPPRRPCPSLPPELSPCPFTCSCPPLPSCHPPAASVTPPPAPPAPESPPPLSHWLSEPMWAWPAAPKGAPRIHFGTPTWPWGFPRCGGGSEGGPGALPACIRAPHPPPQHSHQRVPRGSGAPSSRLPEVSPGARRAGRGSPPPPLPAAPALEPSCGCNNAAGLSPRGRGAGSGAVGMQQEWHRHSFSGPTPASVSPGWSSAWAACTGDCQGLLLLLLLLWSFF